MTGNILYRQILEASGKLLYYGVYLEKQTVAVSYQTENNLVKVRFFGITNGVLLDEWAESVPGVTHATESKGSVYIIGASNAALPSISVTELQGGKITSRTHKLGLTKGGKTICDVTGNYLVCAQGKLVSVLNLKDGTVRNSPEEQEVTTISTSGAG